MAKVCTGRSSKANFKPATPSSISREKTTNKNQRFGTFLTVFNKLFLKFKKVL